MKNKIIILLILGILIFNTNLVSPFFYKNHIKWTLTGFDSVDSAITEMCKPYLKEFIDGTLAQDVPVIHYFDNKVSSYIGTHSKGSGLKACLDNADNNAEKCFCYGGGNHWIAEDRFSHNEDGLVPKYLKKYLSLNFLGHMIVERSYEDQSIAMYVKNNDLVVVDGRLELYDSTALDSLFEETGGSSKYLQLLSQQAGIDITNDARIFRAGYQGEGFYNTVYKDKISLPWWFWTIPSILIIVGLAILIISSIYGSTNWKFMLLSEGLLLMIIGGVLLFSIFTGSTWKITTAFIEVPPQYGYLKVTDADIRFYDQQVQQAVNNYLKTGEAVIEDASGLSYCKNTGSTGECLEKVEGALTEAEKTNLFIIIPIFLVLFLYMNYGVISSAVKIKTNKFVGISSKTLMVIFLAITILIIITTTYNLITK